MPGRITNALRQQLPTIQRAVELQAAVDQRARLRRDAARALAALSSADRRSDLRSRLAVGDAALLAHVVDRDLAQPDHRTHVHYPDDVRGALAHRWEDKAPSSGSPFGPVRSWGYR